MQWTMVKSRSGQKAKQRSAVFQGLLGLLMFGIGSVALRPFEAIIIGLSSAFVLREDMSLARRGNGRSRQ